MTVNTQSCSTDDDGDIYKEEVCVEPHDSISNVRSITSRKKSNSKSSKSGKYYSSSARIKEELDEAALMARVAALKEKQFWKSRKR